MQFVTVEKKNKHCFSSYCKLYAMGSVNKTVFNLLEFWFLGTILVVAVVFNAMLFAGDYTWECETFHTRIHGTGEETMVPPNGTSDFFEAPYFACSRISSKEYGHGATDVDAAIKAAETRCNIEKALGCFWDNTKDEDQDKRHDGYIGTKGACDVVKNPIKTPELDVKRCYSLVDYAKEENFPNLHKDHEDEAKSARTMVLIIAILYALAYLCRFVWHVPYFYEANQQAEFIDRFLRIADWLLTTAGVVLSVVVLVVMHDILLNSREKIDKHQVGGFTQANTDAHFERMEYDMGFWVTVTLTALIFITWVWQCLHIVDAFIGTYTDPRGIMTIPFEMRLRTGMQLRFARVFEEHRVHPGVV